MLTVSLTDTDKQSIVDMLLDRLTPLLKEQEKTVKTNDGEELLTREQVMEKLHIKANKLNQIIRSGDLKFIKLNRRVLVKSSELTNYINRNTIN